jgi:hypothetical protein
VSAEVERDERDSPHYYTTTRYHSLKGLLRGVVACTSWPSRSAKSRESIPTRSFITTATTAATTTTTTLLESDLLSTAVQDDDEPPLENKEVR